MSHKPIGCFKSIEDYFRQFDYERDKCGNILICSNCGEKIPKGELQILPHADGENEPLCKGCYQTYMDYIYERIKNAV